MLFRRKEVYMNANTFMMVTVLEKMLATLGARSFYAAAPCLWNSLPPELRDVKSINIFKRNLKTHLFGQVF